MWAIGRDETRDMRDNFPLLKTARLQLRALVRGDAPALSRLRSDARVNRYLDRNEKTSPDEAIAFINRINQAIKEGRSYYWAISLAGENELSGTICIWNISDDRTTAEIGYEMHPDRQGKGLMQEAMSAVIRFAFGQVGFSTLQAYTHKDNLASSGLLEKNGFTLMKDRKDPENTDLIVYLLCR